MTEDDACTVCKVQARLVGRHRCGDCEPGAMTKSTNCACPPPIFGRPQQHYYDCPWRPPVIKR